MKFDSSPETSPQELLSLCSRALSRYWLLAMGPAVVLAVLVGVYSYRLPSYYRSDALIFIQPQRITSKLIETPDSEEMHERLDGLVQEILSRPRLRAILERYSLYPNLRGPIGMERAVEKFRGEIKIEPIASQSGGSLLQSFRVAFTHRDQKMSFEITKALSNLFIEESIVDQRSEAQGTEEFLDAELEEARKKLETTENLVQQFVRENFGRLPEHLDAAIARLQNAQAQYDANSQIIAANSGRLGNLQRELDDYLKYQSMTQSDIGSPQAGDSPYETMAKLESALIVLTSRYSEQHPDVISTRQRLEALKDQLTREGTDLNRGRTPKAPYARGTDTARGLRRELGELNIQGRTLQEENNNLKVLINQLQKDIEMMPMKEQDLLKIKRDYTNVKDNYESLLKAKQDASLQSSLLRSQKATQFRIVEPAELPVLPAGPNRLIIASLGLAGGLGVFLLLPLSFLTFNHGYKTLKELERDTGMVVLGAVPPMPTPEAALIRQRMAVVTVGTSLFSIVCGGAVMYFVL